MEDLIAQKEHLQSQYDATKEAIAAGEEEYTENFAAIADGLGIANFTTDPLKSLDLLREALVIRRDKVFPGQDDESVITSLNNVSIILRKLLPNMRSLMMMASNQKNDEEELARKEQDHLHEAMQYQRQAVEMFCRLYNDSRHLNAAANLNTLVETLDEYRLGDDEEKIRYLRMAVERFKQSFEEDKKEKEEKEKQKENGNGNEEKKNDDDDDQNEQNENNQQQENEDDDAPDPVLPHYANTLRSLAKRLGSCEESLQLHQEAEKIGAEIAAFERKLLEKMQVVSTATTSKTEAVQEEGEETK